MFPSPCRGIQGRPLANASSSDSETEGWAEATLNSPSLGLFVHAAWSRWEAERGWSQRVRLSRPRKFGFLPTSFTPKILITATTERGSSSYRADHGARARSWIKQIEGGIAAPSPCAP